MGYDMIPWKLVFCQKPLGSCDDPSFLIPIADLPEAPEPGRIPEGADHVHPRPKLSGDQRNARGDHQWRALLLAATRCKHGRTQGDRCIGCPDGVSPSQDGRLIGYYYDATPIRIPTREHQNDVKAWRAGE